MLKAQLTITSYETARRSPRCLKRMHGNSCFQKYFTNSSYCDNFYCSSSPSKPLCHWNLYSALSQLISSLRQFMFTLRRDQCDVVKLFISHLWLAKTVLLNKNPFCSLTNWFSFSSTFCIVRDAFLNKRFAVRTQQREMQQINQCQSYFMPGNLIYDNEIRETAIFAVWGRFKKFQESSCEQQQRKYRQLNYKLWAISYKQPDR